MIKQQNLRFYILPSSQQKHYSCASENFWHFAGFVALQQQVAVYLLYWTAFASGNGQMNFRDDPYGWDSLLASKIEASTKRAAVTVAVQGVNR